MTSVAHRPTRAEVSELIVLLVQATGAREVQGLAAQLGAGGDARAVRPLLRRLGDPHVQASADAERAVCEALVALDVMCGPRDGGFHFVPRRRLSDDVVATIRELGSALPWRYFDTKHV